MMTRLESALRTARNLLLAFAAGILATLATLTWLGPETIIQAGMKLAAVSTSYDWTAAPRDRTADLVSYDTRELVATVEPKRARKP